MSQFNECLRIGTNACILCLTYLCREIKNFINFKKGKNEKRKKNIYKERNVILGLFNTSTS